MQPVNTTMKEFVCLRTEFYQGRFLSTSFRYFTLRNFVYSFSSFRTLVDDAISQYSAALQSNLILEPENSLSKKAIMLIQALLVRALYHQEITKG